MNGIHDMGGLHGFGKVEIEPNEPVFHGRWEGRVYAMTQVLDTKGIYNLDEHRHEIELMDAAAYLTDGYYGRWLFAMERILTRKGIIRADEVDDRVADLKEKKQPRPVRTKERNWPLREEQKIPWGAWRKDVAVSPKFQVGDRVTVKNHQPAGHTRLTHFVRSKTGTITIVNAHRILVIEAGSLVEEGTHASLMAANGLYARLARLQFETGAAALTAAAQ